MIKIVVSDAGTGHRAEYMVSSVPAIGSTVQWRYGDAEVKDIFHNLASDTVTILV